MSGYKFGKEIKAMIPPTLFFLFALYVIALLRHLMLESAGIDIASNVSIVIAALILGKTVVLADLIPIVNRYHHMPLTHNIVWKTALYMVVALLIHYAEMLYHAWGEAGGGFVAANQLLWQELVWAHLLATQIMMFILLAMYCTAHELIRYLGKERVKKIFFGPVED